ncbi:tannase/feruloyl esterase family alpha/beta hydrolase [Caulobacter mirabilis]|uniref:Tannase/feruloyl esterase family alpha/beta hydrolase n=1 Tax=Caulobacter mirabilis TaxID=69666 RepID=A0A2D2AWP2_9CAUL|nr:tannase/feruloyl esterase family alpha/beta hydrolase [Caulobacter mirabilis]ATQ42416.1 tannase/feruloyl esterase family alpha/beta hydrolase [Caulobacter mirabilis]
MTRTRLALAMTAGAGALLAAGAAQAASCEDLAKATFKDATITSAKPYAAGDGVEIGVFGIPPLPTMKAFCRVEATLKPTPKSNVKVEVWLPDAGEWNGRFMATGNGGYGGSLGQPRLAMRPSLHKGYVTAGTDLGHSGDGSTGEDASWALNQPELIADFGHRANHVTAVFAKAVTAAYYGKGPNYSYFHGCSDGGREALMEAQRYPDDFDGIVAGAPANAWPRLMTSMAWSWKSAHADAASRIPDAKLPAIQAAALASCDKLDGVADGVIEDPRRCRFDPATIQCKDGDKDDCLTAPQVVALKALYQGPRDASGKPLFPGYPAGGEAVPNAWTLWVSGEKAQHPSFARSFYRNMVYSDAAWDFPANFDLGKALADTTKTVGPTLASDNPDMSAFAKSGGKLILFHGWADAAISPYATIEYYDAVRSKMTPAKADGFSRLFMAPGVSHCLGGPGPNSFDMLQSVVDWVEKGQAPEQVLATKYDNDYAALLDMPGANVVRTRPLCAWPKVATWDGKGSTDEAASFSCKVPAAK